MKAIILYNELKRLMAATKDFVLKGQRGDTYNFVRFEFHTDHTVRACACDGYKLSTEWGSCSDVQEDFVAYITPEVVGRLNKCEYVEIQAYDGGVELLTDIMNISCPFVSSGRPFVDVDKTIPSDIPSFEIGINGKYLISALKASSTIADINRPVILSFGKDNLSPVIIRTQSYVSRGKDDVKMVLPVRLRGSNDERE